MGALSKITSRSVIGRYYETLDAVTAASWLPAVAMVFSSDQASETYAWLGAAPAMREWVGGRQARSLAENAYIIVNKKFEGTIRIPVDDIRRDKTGQVNIRIDEMAERMAEHPAKLLSNLINTGHSSLCYDGQYFFDTDHAEGDSGAQDNDLSLDIAAPTAPTVAEFESATMKGIGALVGFKDDQGEPMNANSKEFVAMVPTNMLEASLKALNLPVITDGSGARSGMQLGQSGGVGGFRVTPVVNPRLADTAAFFMFRADGRVKPLIVQNELEQIAAVAEGTEHEFKNDEHLYGVKAVRNVGYGYWQHACRIGFT